MIQDIAPHTYHNEYRPVAPDGSSFVLAYENGKSFLLLLRLPDISSGSGTETAVSADAAGSQ